jgi:hypothetical protein
MEEDKISSETLSSSRSKIKNKKKGKQTKIKEIKYSEEYMK